MLKQRIIDCLWELLAVTIFLESAMVIIFIIIPAILKG